MPFYRDPEATGRLDEITVIEDPNMVIEDESGGMWAIFEFIDENTVRAHPVIIDYLLENAERLWTLEELMVSI